MIIFYILATIFLLLLWIVPFTQIFHDVFLTLELPDILKDTIISDYMTHYKDSFKKGRWGEYASTGNLKSIISFYISHYMLGSLLVIFFTFFWWATIIFSLVFYLLSQKLNN